MGAAETLKQMHDIGEYNVLLSTILLISFIVAIVVGIQKIKEVLGVKTKDELSEEEQNKRITRLSERVERLDKRIRDYEKRLDEYTDNLYNKQKQYHERSIEIRNELQDDQKEIKDDVHSLIKSFNSYIAQNNERTVVTLRASLWRLHNEFMSQGFMTPDSLKTFLEMGKVYESAGGDDIYHEILKPDIEALDIHYQDGSIYTKNI